MQHSLHPSGDQRRWPLCGRPTPRRVQSTVLVIIIVLAAAVCIVVSTPAVTASTAALIQAAAALWIALCRPGTSAAEG